MAFTIRYVRQDAAGSGDGTTNTNSGANGAFTIAEAITYSASNTNVKFWIKAAVWTQTTTSLTFNGVALTTAPNVWIGFKTTPGDMGDFGDLPTVSHGTFMSGTEIPAFSFTTGRIIVTGAHQYFVNIDVRGAQTTNGQIYVDVGSSNSMWWRVRSECTSANSSGRAFSTNTTVHTFAFCWFKSTSSANVVNINVANCDCIGCEFVGGDNGNSVSTGTLGLYYCIFSGMAADGLRVTNATGTIKAIGNIFYNIGGDAIEVTATLTVPFILGNNIFSTITGNVLNNSSGGALNGIKAFHNLTHSVGGIFTNQGDVPLWGFQTDSSSPFVNAAGGDFTIADGSNAIAKAAPMMFASGLRSYQDIGATQREEPAGGGSAVPPFNGLISGGK